MSAQRRYLGPFLANGPLTSRLPDWRTIGHRPVYPVSFFGLAKRAYAGNGQQQQDVGWSGTKPGELPPALIDPLVEFVDHGQAGRQGPGPGLGQPKTGEELASGCTE